jgi:shikimate dehydrogenase
VLLLGLIGEKLGHSFSKKYFSEKFANEQISGFSYELFELRAISELPILLKAHPNLIGLNVTIPYKTSIIPYLHKLDETAQLIGAVNTIKISPDGTLHGYNTDWVGFRDSLKGFIRNEHIAKALILGTGGSAKAVMAALSKLGIAALFVSRRQGNGVLTYADLNEDIMTKHRLIVNCTPLGMYPKTDSMPDLPIQWLKPQHFVYDLIYNPELTLLMQMAASKGAHVKNGYEMLVLQAEAAWQIWNT